MVCPAGHMASTKYIYRLKHKGKNDRLVFCFEAKKCRVCSHAAECGFTGKGRHGKQYSITLLTKTQREHLEEQETETFKKEYGIRYVVEAKNSELKHSYHLDRAISYGLDAYTMQGAVALFTSNLVRITRILDEKNRK